MRVCISAGPTREYLDAVRFLSNASSGRMGYALAEAAIAAGWEVDLVSGPVALDAPDGVVLHRVVSSQQMQESLQACFETCDVLIMSAAVSDFRPARSWDGKISRKDGPVTVKLFPTEDILASLTARKRADQLVVAFAVETGEPATLEAKARAELGPKGADWVVVNPPEAMEASESRAAVLDATDVLLPWNNRPKNRLAEEIIRLLGNWSRP